MNAKRFRMQRMVALLCLVALLPRQPVQAQQTQRVVVISADEYWVVRPATCPTHLYGGLIGWLFGYPNGGFTWTPDWTRYRVPNQADYSHAEYHPSSYDGYTQGKGDYITSGDGIISFDTSARWYEPELYVECTATDKFYGGHIIAVNEHYSVLDNRGEIVVCKGRGTALLEPTGENTGFGPDATYDPYSNFGDSDGCESEGGSGGSGGGSATCWDEYIYVEIAYDDGATWEIIWEGWGQVCE